MTAIGISLLVEGESADGRPSLAVGVIIAAVAGGSVIHQVDRWSLRTQSSVHFALMLVTVLPALLLSGWFPQGTTIGYLAVVGVFLAAGILLRTVLYLVVVKLVPRRTQTRDDGE